ncbi:MAG: Cof-type HAD-IIB family hydrolase [Oscillospiraceae bacterium]|nr:Cof-type HAD-IIB family hydrolase [Oscillospiraceae bacterium]
MSIKMIVTDLDGTLLRDDKTVSQRTIDTLKKCREKGIKTTYATARSDSVKLLLPVDEMFDGYVSTNGALAYIGEKQVYNRLIKPETARTFLIAADEAGIKIASQLYGKHYANFNITELWSWLKNEFTDFKTYNIETEKIYSQIENTETVDFLEKNLLDDLYMVIARDNLAMIMHKEAVKSKAVAALADYWGIEKSEIAAFGDDLNDIDLLEFCGVGVAMGNALDQVKKTTKYICGTNENDGVAEWLEENILGENYAK